MIEGTESWRPRKLLDSLQISFNVQREDLSKFDASAKRRQISRASLFRLLMKEYIQRDERDAD